MSRREKDVINMPRYTRIPDPPTKEEIKRSERNVGIFLLIILTLAACFVGAYIFLPAVWSVVKFLLVVPLMGLAVLALAGGSGAEGF